MLVAVPVSALLLPVAVQAAPQPSRAVVAVRAPAGAADVPSSDDTMVDQDGSTTTIVASESPNPGLGRGGGSPEIGPIVVPADTSSFSGAWWLVAFGGVQLVGLFFITRRARHRLSTRDARS
jgi:hypothetical protein